MEGDRVARALNWDGFDKFLIGRRDAAGVDAAPWPTARGQTAPRGPLPGPGRPGPGSHQPRRSPDHQPCPSPLLDLYPCPLSRARRPPPRAPSSFVCGGSGRRPVLGGAAGSNMCPAANGRRCRIGRAWWRSCAGLGWGGRTTGDGGLRTIVNRKTSGRSSSTGLPVVRQRGAGWTDDVVPCDPACRSVCTVRHKHPIGVLDGPHSLARAHSHLTRYPPRRSVHQRHTRASRHDHRQPCRWDVRH